VARVVTSCSRGAEVAHERSEVADRPRLDTLRRLAFRNPDRRYPYTPNIRAELARRITRAEMQLQRFPARAYAGMIASFSLHIRLGNAFELRCMALPLKHSADDRWADVRPIQRRKFCFWHNGMFVGLSDTPGECSSRCVGHGIHKYLYWFRGFTSPLPVTHQLRSLSFRIS
jgi:hypothetical protein